MTLDKPFLGVGSWFFIGLFFMGMWLGEHRHSPEERASQRFKWEMQQKLSLDQLLLQRAQDEK